ncbi:type IV toxin-antitoxin system AbiEi family antitoxin domain-containing protein [Adlercreutzia sp. ZJ304]|uniref:type IV toxin-antitoxin system AbiEi family antitoxin domain-containing protein n=1 Tax=Adlercreutzia sp. ZJ304 TaxID=2709791 RepID=UPI0013EC2433|nr:type IV toxin-antitoxin system AbiEi family antitoxin domain-containing protein [Adlercreutzia sp. ZJ304]
MTRSVAEHIEELGGVATAAQLKEAGFSPGVIEHAFSSGRIDRLTRGVYCSLDVLDDEFAAVTMRWPKCILSHGTALYLLGLSDRVPGNLSVSVPRGYNPQELRRTHPDMRIYREGDKLYGLGRTTVKDPMGIVVPAYDAERSIADIIQERAKGTVNPQLVRDALVGYFRKSDRDLPKLAKMSEALGVRDELQTYLEVLT